MAKTSKSLADNATIPFFYRGEISASKSLMNRALVVKSFFPELELRGDSSCEDVRHMKKALADLASNKNQIFCGEAGTVFRFMSLRASRNPGSFFISGTKRLMERPHQEVVTLLDQLGVAAYLSEDGLKIQGKGWKKPEGRLKILREKSSQFATGFLMSCWDLPFDVEFELFPKGLKDSYWDMSLNLSRDLGMQIKEISQDTFFIPAYQKVNVKNYDIEPDMSSVFAVGAVAALTGDVHIHHMPKKSLQPDYRFIEILNKMKIFTEISTETSPVLTISCTDQFFGIEADLKETPDLFPVLSVLCAFAEGKSVLFGAPRLAHKESNRILKTSELLNLMGVKNEPKPDGIIIYGQGRSLTPKSFEFDPDHDHRMAMAAGVLFRMGWKLKIKTPDVVKKSFPEFWEVIGVTT